MLQESNGFFTQTLCNDLTVHASRNTPRELDRELRLRAFRGVEEAAVFEDGVSVGHAGDVVGDGASAPVGAGACFQANGGVAMFRGHEVDVFEERVEELA